MANTSGRMLRLLSLLQTHRAWTGGELAERLGVSERTLRRDIERLRELGYPVASARGVAGGYQLEAGAALPPLLLDDDEAIAIAVGLRTAAGGVVRGIEEASVRALTKVVRMLPPRLRRRVAALGTDSGSVVTGGGPAVDAEALTTVAQACRDHERLRFEYAGREGALSTRLVEPVALVTLGRRWYLVAWDLDREDWRTFRVDRVADPRSIRYRTTPRVVPGGDPAAFVRERLDTIPQRYRVVVRIEAPAAAVERIIRGWGSAEPLDDATCVLRMDVDELRWPAMVLAGVAAEATVLEPPEFRDHMRRLGELFTRSPESG